MEKIVLNGKRDDITTLWKIPLVTSEGENNPQLISEGETKPHIFSKGAKNDVKLSKGVNYAFNLKQLSSKKLLYNFYTWHYLAQ